VGEVEPVEPDLTELGNEVLLAVLGVAAPCGRADRGPGRQPLPQPLRECPGAGGAQLRRLAKQFRAGGTRRGSRAEPSAADLPATASQLWDSAVEIPATVPGLLQPATSPVAPSLTYAVATGARLNTTL